VSLSEAHYLGAAATTAAAFPLEYAQETLIVAGATVRVEEVGKARAAVANGGPEHAPDGAREPAGFVAPDPKRTAGPVDGGAVERLADVDVAEPGDATLVEQECLDRRLRLAELGREPFPGEPGAERVNAEVAQLRDVADARDRVCGQEAKAPVVAIAQL